jgi:hypothetical protein
MIQRDRWFSDLHLQLIGDRAPLPTPLDIASIDNELRRSNPPFDGLTDVAAWLGLNHPRSDHMQPSIGIRISPPVDLIFPPSRLADDRLHLTLHAHPRFDVNRIGLSIRSSPGNRLESRKQVGKSEIKWKRVRNGRREGMAVIRLSQADSALAMLMIGDSTVRRQWFLDPAKATNNRLVAMQHFDKELRMLRQAVLEPSDAKSFELGIAALLFLHGFTPALPLETDSPDLVVTTPGGKLAIVECTTRIADCNSKLGKLVDRRGALSGALQASHHQAGVYAVLVCALPRHQIAMQAHELETHQVLLITKQELAAALDRVRIPRNPDEVLDAALARLAVTGGRAEP